MTRTGRTTANDTRTLSYPSFTHKGHGPETTGHLYVLVRSKSSDRVVSYWINPKMHWIFGGTITVQGGA